MESELKRNNKVLKGVADEETEDDRKFNEQFQNSVRGMNISLDVETDVIEIRRIKAVLVRRNIHCTMVEKKKGDEM